MMLNEINGYVIKKRRTHHCPSLAETREVKDQFGLVKYFLVLLLYIYACGDT